MNLNFNKTIFSSAWPRAIAVVCAGAILAGCAAEVEPVATLNDPIEGVWVLPKDGNRIQIAPCGTTKEDGFCGKYLPADKTAEDTMNPSLAQWGRPLHGAQIVESLVPGETRGEYKGKHYVPNLGDTLMMDVKQASRDRLDVLVYYGTNTDEAANMAIGSVLFPVGLLDLGWLAVKATVGKKVMRLEQTWTRDKTGGQG